MIDPIDRLRQEYVRRKARNSQYSLRAFARHLQIGSGPLSEILARKRRLTHKQIQRFAERLALSPPEIAQWINRDGGDGPTPLTPEYQQLESDTFTVIADWYHFAILSLLETDGAKLELKWIAARLGISLIEARLAVERLERLKMIRQRESGFEVTTGWTTTHDVPCAAKRHFHRQSLERTMSRLDEVSLDKRDVTSITMAIDPQKIPKAKALIKKFRRDLAQILETGVKQEVYQLSIQLMPVSREEKKP